MTHEHEEVPMDVDTTDADDGNTSGIRENGLLLRPVLPQESGEGLPYAPENWPEPGDIWDWRVGKRTAASGYYLDRYLYLPSRFQKSKRGKDGFASKLSVEQYIQARFPGADTKAFFASFSWKIPSKQVFLTKDENGSFGIFLEEMSEQSISDGHSATAVCKAGNRHCSSLTEKEKAYPVVAMSCDVCCSEPSFCRECCCILCCKTIDLTLGGYSFIRCEATVDDGLICGHVAHINCALRSYMAGTVGGSIGLDSEYYCRRCDTRTDLIQHVRRLLKKCESVEPKDDIEKMLKLGVCILRGSQKKDAKVLLNLVELALQKLECGSALEDIWKVEDNILFGTTGRGFHLENDALGLADQHDLSDSGTGLPHSGPENGTSADYESEYLKLDKEIDQVLQELRKSQDYEYMVARERLHAQRDYLLNLYQQLDNEKSVSARHTPRTDPNALIIASVDREEHIKQEVSKFKDMKKVANGFGRTPRHVLKELFDMDVKE
ncbi:hypothetical protein Ancab_030374 [Ancistrocladus abbreviatus]